LDKDSKLSRPPDHLLPQMNDFITSLPEMINHCVTNSPASKVVLISGNVNGSWAPLPNRWHPSSLGHVWSQCIRYIIYFVKKKIDFVQIELRNDFISEIGVITRQ
jgi:hypothetical protein